MSDAARICSVSEEVCDVLPIPEIVVAISIPKVVPASGDFTGHIVFNEDRVKSMTPLTLAALAEALQEAALWVCKRIPMQG